MIPRLLKIPQHRSFFLFGARNTGKSTLIENQFQGKQSLFIDLLDQGQFDRFDSRPNQLYDTVSALPKEITHVVIDEIMNMFACEIIVSKNIDFRISVPQRALKPIWSLSGRENNVISRD